MNKQPQSLEEAGIGLRNSYTELGKAIYEVLKSTMKAIERFCVSVKRKGR